MKDRSFNSIEDRVAHLREVNATLRTRLQEAERLLREATDDANSWRPVTLSWVSRADAWLKGVKANE